MQKGGLALKATLTQSTQGVPNPLTAKCRTRGVCVCVCVCVCVWTCRQSNMADHTRVGAGILSVSYSTD